MGVREGAKQNTEGISVVLSRRTCFGAEMQTPLVVVVAFEKYGSNMSLPPTGRERRVPSNGVECIRQAPGGVGNC